MSLEPAKYALRLWRGATYTKRLTLLEGELGSAPKNLTGYSSTCTIKNAAGGAVLLTLNSPADIVLGGLAGTLDLTISSTVTSGLAWTKGVYELFITSPVAAGSVTDILLFGSVTVRDI